MSTEFENKHPFMGAVLWTVLVFGMGISTTKAGFLITHFYSYSTFEPVVHVIERPSIFGPKDGLVYAVEEARPYEVIPQIHKTFNTTTDGPDAKQQAIEYAKTIIPSAKKKDPARERKEVWRK